MIHISHIIIVLLLNSVMVFSQETIMLRSNSFRLEDESFYIEKVFDDRLEQYLGSVPDISGNISNLKLHDGASGAVKKFMDSALPKSDKKKPVQIRIKTLEIQQAQTSIDELTTRVYVRLAFFSTNRPLEGELFNIDHYEEAIFPLSDTHEVWETHEKRIRAALEYCILKFAASINTKQDNSSFSSNKSVLETDFALGKWYNLLTYKRIFDKNNEGWEVSYTGFSDNEQDFIIPFELSYGQIRAKSNLIKERGYISLDSFIFGGGFNGYIKIIPGLYVDLGLNIPLGIEVLRDLDDKKSHNFLIGVGANQGVKIIPWKDYGIVFGIGLFQQIQTSKVYKSNFSFELELGINF